MSKLLIRAPLVAARWTLCAAGAAALLITALVATPLSRPPELASISAARGTVDFSALPAVERFQARDGTWLGFRHYAAASPASGRAAIVIHGSSGSSGGTIHALSGALAARGVETWAIDIRGHGASGTRGDIGYVGQLEHDLADLVAVIRKTTPSAPLTLVGHSSGGGFALRVAGSPIQDLFARTVLLAPYLGYNSPTNRPKSGGWASADIPRIVGLAILRAVGITCCEALPVLALAVPPNSEKNLVATYSDRLMRNFAVHDGNFHRDLAAARKPVTLFSGADDELMLVDKYAPAVHAVAPAVDVKLIDGVNHMGIVSAPRAISMIADEVAKAGERIVMSIESREAAAALSDIEDIVRRVRQSRIYQLASLLLIMWGALVFLGNIGSFLWPRMAGYIWLAVNVVGVAGSFAISAFGHARTGVHSFDGRALAALLLFFAFGMFTCWLGHFGPRELGTFWPIYFMLVYTAAGLWAGQAFVAIGLSITALTLIGYFFVGPWFEPWMAVVNGGGLMLGGLWMRRS